MYPTWGPRRPQVPLLGPPVPQLGALQTDLKRRPRGLPERFWTNFGPLGEALEARKNCKIQGFCCISRSATETSQNAQISPWEVPKRPPRGSQEQPGTPQEPPKFGFLAALAAKWGPPGRPRALRRPPGADFGPSRGRFSTFQGTPFMTFSTLGGHVRSCPVCKACASIRPASPDVLV